MNQLLLKSETKSFEDIRTKANHVFDLLDVSETTRADYKQRISLFLEYVQNQGFDRDVFLSFKRTLAKRIDISIATKNKYLATARIFLKELNRQGLIPVDVTQNVKVFQQSKKHKKDGLNESEISLLADKMRQLPCTPSNTRLKAVLSLLSKQ